MEISKLYDTIGAATLNERRTEVIPIDGSYLYDVGKWLQPIETIGQNSTYWEAWINTHQAINALEELLTRSVYTNHLRLTVQPGKALLAQLNSISDKAGKEETSKTKLSFMDAHTLSESFRAFEAVFKAEFRNGSSYLASPKGGFEIGKLIFQGEAFMPSTLSMKAPEAIDDVRQGTRCLAFELYTAAGFHLHRANESVLLKYFDQLSRGQDRPENRNLGAYIKALEQLGAPQPIIRCLRDLKDMHRNPLMHPDESIDELDDAVGLLNSVYTAIAAMLKQMPGFVTI